MHGRARFGSTVFVMGLATLVACGGSTDTSAGDSGASGDASGGGDGSAGSDAGTRDASDAALSDGGGRTPAHHRPDDSQCSQPASAGNCTLTGGGAQCTKDNQCTTGANGRCVQTMGGALTCFCTYDACVHDTDCATGKLCVCHGSAFTGGAGNTCTDGNCRIDADCGAAKYCSPSHGTSGCGGVTGYFCHTSSDQCTDDSDCSGGGGSQVCAWSSANNRWTCQQQLLCP